MRAWLRYTAVWLCGLALMAVSPLPAAAQTDDSDIGAEEPVTPPAASKNPANQSPTQAVPAAEPEKPITYTHIKLQGLNKVTARTSEVEAPIGLVTRFGNLEIIARACRKSAPEEQPENAGLMEIWELKPNESPKRIFYGWMFSSSPSLSALEHAVYDVTVLECLAKPVENP